MFRTCDSARENRTTKILCLSRKGDEAFAQNSRRGEFHAPRESKRDFAKSEFSIVAATYFIMGLDDDASGA